MRYELANRFVLISWIFHLWIPVVIQVNIFDLAKDSAFQNSLDL